MLVKIHTKIDNEEIVLFAHLSGEFEVDKLVSSTNYAVSLPNPSFKEELAIKQLNTSTVVKYHKNSIYGPFILTNRDIMYYISPVTDEERNEINKLSLEETENILLGDTWKSLQTECPHCGEVFDIENSDIDSVIVCKSCPNKFIPKK